MLAKNTVPGKRIVFKSSSRLPSTGGALKLKKQQTEVKKNRHEKQD